MSSSSEHSHGHPYIGSLLATDAIKSLTARVDFCKNCDVNEESDLYGFSLIHDMHRRQHDEPSGAGSSSILNDFQSDVNWNNPGAVELMIRSYGLSDFTFANNLLPASEFPSFTHSSIRFQQYEMLKERLIAEGLQMKASKKYQSAIECFTNALHFNDLDVNALKYRAECFENLQKRKSAIKDYKKILKIAPNNADAEVAIHRLDGNTERSDISLSSSIVRKPHYDSMAATIGKLEKELNVGRIKEKQDECAFEGLSDHHSDNSSGSGKDDSVTKSATRHEKKSSSRHRKRSSREKRKRSDYSDADSTDSDTDRERRRKKRDKKKRKRKEAKRSKSSKEADNIKG